MKPNKASVVLRVPTSSGAWEELELAIDFDHTTNGQVLIARRPSYGQLAASPPLVSIPLAHVVNLIDLMKG